MYHQLYFKIIQFKYIDSMASMRETVECLVKRSEEHSEYRKSWTWLPVSSKLPIGPLLHKEFVYTCYEKEWSQLRFSISSLLEDRELGLKSKFASLLWQRFRFYKARDEPKVVGPGYFVQTAQLSLCGLLTVLNFGVLMQAYLILLDFLALLSPVK